MFIFSEEENESNEMKIISCRTTKKLNKDNIEETVILENQIEIHDYKHLGLYQLALWQNFRPESMNLL